MKYVELHACSAFSFLRGASFPEQLAETAAELGMPAMALLDRNGVYGAQRFSVAARENNVRPIIGCELSMEDGALLPVLVENRTGYKHLCELLTEAHLRSEKGTCAVQWNELPQFSEGLVVLFNSSIFSGIFCAERNTLTTNLSILRMIIDCHSWSRMAFNTPSLTAAKFLMCSLVFANTLTSMPLENGRPR